MLPLRISIPKWVRLITDNQQIKHNIRKISIPKWVRLIFNSLKTVFAFSKISIPKWVRLILEAEAALLGAIIYFNSKMGTIN